MLEIEGFNFGITLKTFHTEPIVQKESKKMKKYLELKKIGQGGMGTVFEALSVETKEKVALKKIFCENYDQLNLNLNEAMFAKGLSHPNLVKYDDAFITFENYSPYTLCIVMELMTGDLNSIIKRYRAKKEILPEELLLNFMKQITNGLDYLHEKKLVRNIKIN